MPRRLKLRASLLLAAVLLLPVSAKAEYLLGVGDVVEFSAAGNVDLRQRSRVDPQGEITIPLIGQVPAGGRPLSAIRKDVEHLLPTKSLRRKTSQGLEVSIIGPDEIMLEIVEYRPVYVNGDVSKSGEVQYRPGLVVRQAVALSGGYDLLHFRADSHPVMQSADLRAEYAALWTDYAQARLKRSRLEAELAGQADLSASTIKSEQLPVPQSTINQISEFEAQKLKAGQADTTKEQLSLTRQLQQTDRQAALITEQLEKTRQGVQLATADLERIQGLFERGLTPVTRVAEERRLTLSSQTQLLQTTERLGQVTKEREEISRKLEKVQDQRRMDLSQELQDTIIKLATIQSKLQAVDEKLTYAHLLKSQLTRGKGASPELVIYRKGVNARERVLADEDTEMLPGDTLDVTLRTQGAVEALKR